MVEQDAPRPDAAAEPVACVFERALIAGCAGCAEGRQHWIGEHLEMRCSTRRAAERCRRFLARLKQNAAFACGETRLAAVLTHGREMRIQCGGLQGITAWLAGQPSAAINVVEVLRRVADRDPEFEAVPFDRIMPYIAAFNPRPRRRRPGR